MSSEPWRAAVRLLWAGQSVSIVGDQVTLLALPVAALALGAGPAAVATLSAAATMPFAVLSLPAGAWVARLGLRRAMLGADVVRGLALLSLPLTAWLGRLGYPQLLGVALVVGCATVFFQIAYQSLTPVLVPEPGRLRSANTRLQASESAAQIAGPALGGALIQALGATRAFAVDAGTYAASVATLAVLRAPGDRPATGTGPIARYTRDGVRHVWREPALRAVLVASVWFNAGLGGYQALLVVFAVRAAGVPASTLGLALGVGGLGLPLGLLASGTLERRFGTPFVLIAGAGASAAGMLVVATAAGRPAPYVIGAGTFVGAVGGGMWGVTALTTRQRLSPARQRAMATAVFRWATYSAIPLGALGAGAVSSLFGVRAAMFTLTALAQLCTVPLLRAPLPDFRERTTDDQPWRHHRQHPSPARRWRHRHLGGRAGAQPAGSRR